MKMSSFGYLVKEGAKNIYTNRLMSFASVGTLVACMLLIGGSILLSMNVNQIVGYVEQQNEIAVFLYDDITEEQVMKIDAQIALIENVYDATYLDKEAVLKEQQASLGDLSILLEDLEGEENPYPPTYRLKVRDLSELSTTVMKLRAIEGVQSIVAPNQVAEVVTSVKNAVSVGGMLIVGILLLVSLVIIANTIKVTVFNRRREINIMKYVGATDSFIRLPFFVEGFLLGLISAVLAFGLLWVGYDYIIQVIARSDSMWIVQAYQNMIRFSQISVPLFLWFLGGGICIGVFGSMFFVSRYLKV
jgi:cell division transport system permease protein